MLSEYDEPLTENPFYKRIEPDIISKASESDWIICVPRAGTVTNVAPEDVLEHVLVPDGNERFFTLTNKPLRVADKTITYGDSKVRILFDETVYLDRTRKYKLWCIEQPLYRRNEDSDEGFLLVSNFRSCVAYLHTENYNILGELRDVIEPQLSELDRKSVASLKEIVYRLYMQCLQVASRNPFIQEKCTDKPFTENINGAIEMYMQRCIYDKLFSEIRNACAKSDADFNKILRNVFTIQSKDLEIDNRLHEVIPSARREMCNIDQYRSVSGKIECLRRAFKRISARTFGETEPYRVNGEELLKIFVFIIIKSNVNDWIANLTYVTQFRWNNNNSIDENAFLLTNLEAAIEYLRSGALSVRIVSNNDSIAIDRLFETIRSGDLFEVKQIVEGSEFDPDERNLCHPLCSCDKCESYVGERCSLKCNEKGCTPLHAACFFGHPQLVEYFLDRAANVNCADYSQATPLHYAAARGHQNALLLLLHAEANAYPRDHDANTPLHAAANAGHDSCVKALLYFLEQKFGPVDVNCKNHGGDTPLHLASKWGYVDIVRLLLQYGADVTVKNKSGKSAFDFAHNSYVEQLLNDSETLNEFEMVPSHPCYDIKENRSSRSKKKIDLLFNAIVKNDLPLMSFYLGIPTPTVSSKILSDLACHPLCTCEKCRKNVEDTWHRVPENGQILNVNAYNSEGYTALHVAARYGRDEMLRLLLDYGAHVNVKTKLFGFAPLHIACQYQRVHVLRELVKCGGCDVDACDSKGNTALHYACCNDDRKMVEICLASGASTTIKNNEGKTAYRAAKDRRLTNIARLLKGKRDSSDEEHCTINVDTTTRNNAPETVHWK